MIVEIEKFHYRSTSALESFQNQGLMYAAKWFAFSTPVYEAKILLAALDYSNHNKFCKTYLCQNITYIHFIVCLPEGL